MHHRLLSPQQLRELSGRSDRAGALRLTVHLALIAIGVVLVAHANAWTLLPAMVLLGIPLAALFAPVHETMHGTAFATRRANAVVGWLCACPSLLNWHFYCSFHVAHHRFTQDPQRDPELTPMPPSSLDGYALRVLALPYWRARLSVLRAAWRGDLSAYPYVTATAAPRIIRSMRLMTLFVLGSGLAAMLLIGWWAPLIYWILPMLLGQPMLRLYLLTEHTLCSLDDNGLTNTRTTLTTALMRLLMWNMSYHAEHHLYPAIPFHRLAAAHGMLGDRLAVVQNGYISWHAAFVRRLLA